LDKADDINSFLAQEERRALRMSQISIGIRDEAFDVVQESMIRFVEKYSHKPAQEWRPLFYRVLNNCLIDWHRRQKVRSAFLGWFSHADEMEQIESRQPCPVRKLQTSKAMEELQTALQCLPLRQQQAVLLRVWDGMDVQTTAVAMGVSVGSVKTHFSRGLKALQKSLGDHWP
jgi:RNA polymerase sigma-70 factor (ECF subfamily)